MTPKPKKERDLRNGWAEARRIVWSSRHRLALGLVLMLLNRLSSFALPASIKFLVDNVMAGREAEMLRWIALGAGAGILIQATTSFLLSLVLGVAAQRAINDARIRLHAHVARLPTRYFDENKTGVMISRMMNDAEGIRNLVGTGLVQLVGGAFTAVVAVGVLFWISWRLTLVSVTVFALFGAMLMYGFSKIRPIFRQRSKLSAALVGRLSEFLSGIRVVKAYTAEKREERVFAQGANKLFRNISKSMIGVSAITASATFLFGSTAVGLMLLGGHEVLVGRMTAGELVSYAAFTVLVIAPMVSITSIGTQITEALAGLDRIREIFSETREDQEDPTLTRMPELRGEIRFDDVRFEYEEGKPVLHGVSFVAPPGTTTALVGSSGSGKSTLISLVMAFNRPKSGRICIDGRDLASIRLSDYRDHLGIVLQENFLFDGTIGENILYGNPRATRAAMLEAARIAHCDEFVERFEKTYDTIVGERGVKLSGGQRQRVAIARAILADPRILILDEATSSLDSESEEMIQDGLRHLLEGRTTFVIAHRLSTIQNADQILVLEGGLVVERGRHAELLALGGRYRTLYEKQYRLATNLFVNPGEDLTPSEEPAAAGDQPAE